MSASAVRPGTKSPSAPAGVVPLRLSAEVDAYHGVPELRRELVNAGPHPRGHAQPYVLVRAARCSLRPRRARQLPDSFAFAALAREVVQETTPHDAPQVAQLGPGVNQSRAVAREAHERLVEDVAGHVLVGAALLEPGEESGVSLVVEAGGAGAMLARSGHRCVVGCGALGAAAHSARAAARSRWKSVVCHISRRARWASCRAASSSLG